LFYDIADRFGIADRYIGCCVLVATALLVVSARIGLIVGSFLAFVVTALVTNCYGWLRLVTASYSWLQPATDRLQLRV
jgi:hypothetical protein